MKNKKVICLPMAAVLALTLGVDAFAQQDITAVGGDFRNDRASVSYSVGQVAVCTSMERAVTVVSVTRQFQEGVQQPLREGDPVAGIDALDVRLLVYPNPTTDEVVMEGAVDGKPLHYELFDAMGKRLSQGVCTDGHEVINLRPFSAGQYMLFVTSDEKNHKRMNTYKIIKSR